ncbi:phage minor head protein [Halomicroarcula sp. GCM10025709]|uniref:phage head morphogenesis protein n=1 Tax=Haloarcula TaxID=2237 RepID=UPI0024C4481F|nr:phage minor head protein [Halomicroarcula sp. YJ-61-S]
MSCCTHTANATRSGDPTNTRSLRQAFIAELARRMRRVRGLVRTTVGYENDALELTGNADPEETFGVSTDPARLREFEAWLRNAIREELVEPKPPSPVQSGAHWTAEYVRRAYLVGYNQATGRLFQQGVSVDNPDDEDILNLPTPRRQLRQLYLRAFEALESVPTEAAQQVRETLTVGLDEGANPRELASRLNQELESITRDRLATIARSEIINSHSEATLDRYEDAGVDVVSHGEWATAADTRVCAICEALEGKAFTITEMREATFEMEGVSFEIRLKPPAHPNGRCTILPAVGADPPASPLQERLPDSPAQQAATARVVA